MKAFLTALLLLMVSQVSAQPFGPQIRELSQRTRFEGHPTRDDPPPFNRASFANCFVNWQCRNDPYLHSDVEQFFAQTANVSWPKNVNQFHRYLCNLLSPRHDGDDGGHLLDDSDVVNMFLSFIGANYWIGEQGRHPYPGNETFWWCFLDSLSVYHVWPGFFSNFPSYTTNVSGASTIANQFAGLGYGLGQGGAGFYVDPVQFTSSSPTIPDEKAPNERFVYSRANKVLISIDITGVANTTKPLDFYFAQIQVLFHPGSYPRATIGEILELINLKGTLEWLNLCNVFCVNCTPGTVCNHLPF